jgi:hypothetical protein
MLKTFDILNTMKTILPLMLVLLYGCASDSSYIASSDEVTVGVYGIGETIDLAEKNGFRNAIQEVFGTLTLSNRQVINDALFEDAISYSSGVIRGYQVLGSETRNDGLYNLSMLVTVSASALQGNFEVFSDTTNIDGATLASEVDSILAQIYTFNDRLERAGQTLSFVAREVGVNYFLVETGALQLSQQSLNYRLLVDVDISVNENFRHQLCLASQIYNSALPRGVENTAEVRQLRVDTHPWDEPLCYVWISDTHLEIIADSFSHNLGVCLEFFDRSGNIVQRAFYDLLPIWFYDRSFPNPSGSILVGTQGRFLGQGAVNFYRGRGRVGDVFDYGGVELVPWKSRYTLEIPAMSVSLIERLESSLASIKKLSQCSEL